jgi:hypothetical protein
VIRRRPLIRRPWLDHGSRTEAQRESCWICYRTLQVARQSSTLPGVFTDESWLLATILWPRRRDYESRPSI